MCKGTVTHLRCPHKLVHFAVRCAGNCELPDGPRFMLEDTCAGCHPSFRVHLINAKYERVRVELTEKLRLAIHEGRADEQQKMHRELALAQSACIQEVLLARQYRVPVEGVIWPGKVEEE